MRLSRPCYDKQHRCPGWAGGGGKSAKKTLCDGGYIHFLFGQEWEYKRLWKWRFHRCSKCDVRVLPFVTRYFDPTWYLFTGPRWLRNLRWWMEDRKHS